MNNHSELVRELHREFDIHAYFPFKEVEAFIIRRDKKNAEPLVNVENKYRHLKTLIKDVEDTDEQNLFHITSRDLIIAIDATLKNLGAE